MQNGKLDYHSLINALVVLTLLILLLVWLGQIARELARSPQRLRQAGGWFLLLLTATLALGLVGFVYWESQLVWSLLE